MLKYGPFEKIIALLLLIPALALTMTVAGCGSGEETDTAARSTTKVGGQEPMPMIQSADDTVTVQEQDSPYGAGTNVAQTVGLTLDGLQLLDVRWADHGSFFRVVFDMGTADGELLMQTPRAEGSMENGGKQVRLLLGGVRSISDNPDAQATELPIDDDLVLSIKRIPSHDDQALLYTIELSRPATYALGGLSAPGRIVVDIMKG